MASSDDLPSLLGAIRACTVCAAHLPAGPRPIVQADGKARVVIIGQAPGRRVHESGVPWADASGVRLRAWLGMTESEFYDPARTALVPMGFCFPGTGPSGDLPPRRECAPLWHDRLLALLPPDRLTVIVGTYAQRRYADRTHGTVADTVARWREFLPGRIVMPHPSPRNRSWLARNPWFEADTVPAVRSRVRQVLGEG
ncbi:MAG TPA: uracil-DNA glycosylase family protein [Solirubrobacteraceae bacterium]